MTQFGYKRKMSSYMLQLTKTPELVLHIGRRLLHSKPPNNYMYQAPIYCYMFNVYSLRYR